jgi:hypothetical protein
LPANTPLDFRFEIETFNVSDGGRRVASPLLTDRDRPSTEASRPVYPIGDLWSLAPIPYAALSGARTRDHVHPPGKASRPEFDATGGR